MFNFFKKKQPEKPTIQTFTLGAHKTIEDTRAIPYAQVAKPEADAVPSNYLTDISDFPKLYQGPLGTCVAHAFALTKMILDKVETGKVAVYSRRFIYSLARKFGAYDNTSDIGQGLWPDDAAKVLTAVGTVVENGLDDSSLPHTSYIDLLVTDEMRKEANKYRAGGYARVQVNVEEIRKAVRQTKAVPIMIPIDWFKIDVDGTVHAPEDIYGYHEVTIIGYEISPRPRFIFENWWPGWGTNGKGFINFDEVPQVIIEAKAFTDIPNDLIERAKNTQYVFLTTLRQGMIGDAVLQMQKRLTGYGVFKGKEDGRFGPFTTQAVKEWQKLKGLDDDGIFGPKSRGVMNSEIAIGKQKSKIDLWCEIIAKIENAKPSLHNPGNIKYFKGFKTSEKAIGKDYRGICIYPDDETGYMVLRDFLVRCASGNSSNYLPTMTMYEFYGGIPGSKKYTGYAPDNDGNNSKKYADDVIRYLQIDPQAPISSLL